MKRIDATDTHDPQQTIEHLKRQLIDAQRQTALGELLGTTTHEFNNILMTVINYAKMGLRHKDDETREKSLNKILKAGERAAQISNNILGMARNRSTALEPTDLVKLIDDSLMLLERELRKYRINIDRRIGQVPAAMANGNQIQQVLLNLLINARQAMGHGGRGGEIQLSLTHDPTDKMIVLTVRDNGVGIPQAQLPHIFDAFYSTKSGPDETGKGGTGLGLAACKDIIQAHNGRIRVESKVGVGTAFIIKLPVAMTATVPNGFEMPVPKAAPTPIP